MENIKQKIVEIITHTHKTPIEQADEILLLFSISGRSEHLLQAYKEGFDAAVETLVGANKVVQQKRLQ